MAKIVGAPTLDDALAALRERVAEREARGEKSLIFCEDKLTLLAERAILLRLGGTFTAEVTTFARYLSGPRVLSKQGSVMEVFDILAENADRLVCFRENAAQAVYETIAQLSASRVDADMLRLCAENAEGALAGKLSDLAFVLERYTERLNARGLLDENGYLALLPEKLSAGELADTNLFFFGFSSFTRQACEGVRAALNHAKSVTGIFLAGREELYTNEAARAFRRLCEETGQAEPSMVGCSLAGDALALRNGLFSPEKLSKEPVAAPTVRRFAAQDEAEEFETVAALIKKHVAEGMRYRDIAVLVAGEESFPAVEKAFGSFRIPFFADKKRAFSEHPFCVFVLDLITAVADGVLPDEADAVLSSVYFGEAGEYRNYLLKYGNYRGGARREIKEGDAVRDYDRAFLVSCRERLLNMLACFPAKGKGGKFTDGVRALLSLARAEEVTEKLKACFTGQEREFLDLTRLDGLLGEFDLLARDRTFTAREFRDALKNGAEALKVSMIPQSADAVFVGDATESRFERVAALFATGLTDELPRASQDTAVISDREIGKLSALQVEIEPAIAQVNARARESLALNLCSFTDALYLSYPLGKGGAETERGLILQDVEKLFRMPPMPELFPYDCCEEEPAARRLSALGQGFETGREDDAAKYSALYALLEETGGSPERILKGGEKEPVPAAESLYFGGAVSPTLLESYFACPYAGFAARGLRLREREERPVLDTDSGTLLHAVLERVAKQFNELRDEAACRALAVKTCGELLRARFAAIYDTGAGKYTAKRLEEESAEVCAAAYRQLALSAFRVGETEGKITLPELSLAGTTDRVDVSDGYVRVIDYKTGAIDDSPTAYYTGRKLQLELYLRGAARGRIPAGAFYFPAADVYTKQDETKFRMSGFYCGEDEVLCRMDKGLQEGGKSELFDGKRDGKFTDRGMSAEDFDAFLDYSLLVSSRAEHEMRRGNIAPSPYEGVCAWCKLKSLCGFVGQPRKESALKCADIVKIVRREKGEK